MTKREKVIAAIVYEVFLEGKATSTAIRLMAEGRIGADAFRKACDRGMAMRDKRDKEDGIK